MQSVIIVLVVVLEIESAKTASRTNRMTNKIGVQQPIFSPTKFLSRLNWPFFWLAAGLTPETYNITLRAHLLRQPAPLIKSMVFEESSPVQGCSSNFTVWLSWDVMSLSRLFKYSLLRA